MTFAPGTRLGTYEIVGPLGAGGMGEVHRARDTKLKREVAIRLLPDAFARDADRVARFGREAEVLASLNHPHIKGITHRDLKPANIQMSPDGRVKVLDFGLAKVHEPSSSASSDGTAVTTMTSPAMTQMGVILGTAAYMSPEQARGRAVDKRADMSETLASVLKDQPDWARVPLQVRPLLERCLEKDPKKRLRDIGDMPARTHVTFLMNFADEVRRLTASTAAPR